MHEGERSSKLKARSPAATSQHGDSAIFTVKYVLNAGTISSVRTTATAGPPHARPHTGTVRPRWMRPSTLVPYTAWVNASLTASQVVVARRILKVVDAEPVGVEQVGVGVVLVEHLG